MQACGVASALRPPCLGPDRAGHAAVATRCAPRGSSRLSRAVPSATPVPSAALAAPAAASSAALTAIGPAFGWVVTVVGLSGVMLTWMVIGVAKARRAAGVAYPAVYAEEDTEAAQKFNCAMRTHYNTLEQFPIFLGTLLTLGLTRPRVAAVAGLIWLVARVHYFREYSSGDPQRRHKASGVSFLVVMFLIGSTVVMGLGMTGVVQALLRQLL